MSIQSLADEALAQGREHDAAVLDRMSVEAYEMRQRIEAVPEWAKELAIDTRIPIEAKIEHDLLEHREWTSKRGNMMVEVTFADGEKKEFTAGSYIQWNRGDIEEEEDMTKHVSIDNGTSYMTAEEAIEEIENGIGWETVVNAMDDETREKVHAENAPCTNLEFLERYLELADYDLVVG